VNSVSIVPVGQDETTGTACTPLKPFDDVLAGKPFDQVDTFGRACLESRGQQNDVSVPTNCISKRAGNYPMTILVRIIPSLKMASG
jgi:hypothetical protein